MARTGLIRLIALSILAALVGCVGYTTYPPPESGKGADAAFNSPNVPPAPDVIYSALAYTIGRYPVAGAYAINLPPELDAKRARYIHDLLNDDDARLLTADAVAQGLPIYHVARVWIRGPYAEVDVLRPVMDVPGPGGAEVTQQVTLTLKPRLARWRVTGARSAPIGLSTPPALSLRDADTAAAIVDASPADADPG